MTPEIFPTDALSTTILPDRRPAALAITGAGLTHRGKVRAQNEDAILTDPSGRLWAVADGMGGHQNGAMASDIVIDCLAGIADGEEPTEAMEHRLEEANRQVRAAAARMGATMGATVVAVCIAAGIAHVAWAGDSRAYLFRNGRLRMLTHDHTLVQDLVDRGDLDPAAAENHPEAHIVTRAVGGADEIEVDHVFAALIPEDRLLLCSDGLPRCLFETTIEAALQAARSPETACRALVQEALEAGAPDNVSVIVVDLVRG